MKIVNILPLTFCILIRQIASKYSITIMEDQTCLSYVYEFCNFDSSMFNYVLCRSELNLGVERSSFTLIGCYREHADQERFVRVCISCSHPV